MTSTHRSAGPVEVRAKRADDRDACVALVLEVHRVDGYPGHLPQDVAAFVMPPYETAAWVAVGDGVVVGHVALHEAAGDPVLPVAQRATGLPPERLAVVARLLVSPHARRLGLGRRLLEVATGHAHANGQTVALDVVRTFAPAIALYRSAGWSEIEPLTLQLGATVLDLLVFLDPDAASPPR